MLLISGFDSSAFVNPTRAEGEIMPSAGTFEDRTLTVRDIESAQLLLLPQVFFGISADNFV